MLVTTLACYLQGNAKKIDIYELSLDQNLATPEIKNKLKDAVQDFQYKQAVELIKQNYEVELTRDNEVIIVTIPAERLLPPTTLYSLQPGLRRSSPCYVT